MIDRSKYSLNGVYRWEHFAERARRNNFPRVPIGSLGGTDGWYLLLRVKTNRTIIYPFISCDGKPDLVLRFFFNIIKEDGSSAFEVVAISTIKTGCGPKGLEMNVQDLLNEYNGYLDKDGALTIEYGAHVDVVFGNDGIRKFNFNDHFFNSENSLAIKYSAKDRPTKVLYGHKQLLRFHSPLFKNQVTAVSLGMFEEWLIEECLQIAHGVRIQPDEICMITGIADFHQLKNVVQYVDQQMIETTWNWQEALLELFLFEYCIDYRLNHFLTHLVNQFECLEDLQKTIRKLNIDKMSGEAMKTFAAKIFDLGT